MRPVRQEVQIDLVIRGVCTLQPGVLGLSDNIRVISIVGRFLEHSRVFYFYNGGKELVYLSSADWMDRNFFRRVEVAFPILLPELKRRVLDEAFTYALKDNQLAWRALPDGSYERVQNDEPACNMHLELMKLLG